MKTKETSTKTPKIEMTPELERDLEWFKKLNQLRINLVEAEFLLELSDDPRFVLRQNGSDWCCHFVKAA